jgi:hypothetical protein
MQSMPPDWMPGQQEAAVPPAGCLDPRLWLQAHDLAVQHVMQRGMCVVCRVPAPCRIAAAAEDAKARAMPPQPAAEASTMELPLPPPKQRPAPAAPPPPAADPPPRARGGAGWFRAAAQSLSDASIPAPSYLQDDTDPGDDDDDSHQVFHTGHDPARDPASERFRQFNEDMYDPTVEEDLAEPPPEPAAPVGARFPRESRAGKRRRGR